MMRLRLAIRNLWRNSRRTALCIAMVSSGFLAIVMFRGFAQSLVDDVRYIAIRIQYSHLQVGTKTGWDGTPVDDTKEKYLSDAESLAERIKVAVDAEKVVPRLSFFGLIGNEEASVAAQAVGVDPIYEKDVMTSLGYLEGKPIDPESEEGILVGFGLAKQMRMKIGDQLTLIANTLDGAVNAVDLTVAGIVTSGLAEFDRWTFYLPLKTAQKVLDTDRVERLAVYLKEPHNLKKAIPIVQSALPPGLEIRTYRELSDIFRQTEIFFETQNRVLAAIIIALVMLSILNIVGNSVVERTGEIGTLRALGERQRDILALFFYEGIALALISSVLGAGLGLLLCFSLNKLGLPITIPGAIQPLPLRFSVVPEAYFEATLLTIITATFGSVWPARRAAKLAVTEALRRNLE